MVTWPMKLRDPERSRSWPQYVWRLVSQKRLEIPTWWQWSTYRKWIPGNQMVTWWHHVTPNAQWREPNMLRTQYLENGWRYGLGDNGAPIKCLPGMTSHDYEGQGRDPKTFCAQYLKNGWRFRLRCNGEPIGYGAWRVKGSRDRWRHVAQKGQGGDLIMFDVHYLENGWSTNRKWGMASRMVWCSMSSRVPVFLFGTDYILSLHFHNRYIAWKYRKTANIIEKLNFITLLTAIVHCFTHRKQQKW